MSGTPVLNRSCEVHANWTMLASGHLDLIAGRRSQLASKIEEGYDITGEEAERQIKSFEEQRAPASRQFSLTTPRVSPGRHQGPRP